MTYIVQEKENTVCTLSLAGRFSAKDIANLYHERWVIERGFRDIKRSMYSYAEALRSEKNELIYQEIGLCLLVYNVVR